MQIKKGKNERRQVGKTHKLCANKDFFKPHENSEEQRKNGIKSITLVDKDEIEEEEEDEKKMKWDELKLRKD